MRRTVVLLASMALAVLLASAVALALPSETPDPTPMLNGPVRTFAQVGDNIWVGGNFTQVKTRSGSVIANVSNVAVFNRVTGDYVPNIAPELGAGNTAANVRDIDVYDNNVVIGGDFPGPAGTQKNLVVVNGTSGQVIRWYSSPQLQSVLAAPDLGRIYGGGVSLSAFDFATGKMLWSRATTMVDTTIHSHNPGAGYRDLERDGSKIWAACACDNLSVSPHKTLSLLKLDTDGGRDSSWVAKVGSSDLFGISVTQTNDTLYLGTGGSDWVGAFSKANGSLLWKKDTSGSTQVVELMEGKLVIGGHFVEVADQAGDNCGFRSSNPKSLDPNNECQRRDGLAAYSFGGTLDPNWSPTLAGKYNLAWALLPEEDPLAVGIQTGRLYVGGEYLTVNGVKQNYYSRLSEANAGPPDTTIVSGPSGVVGPSVSFDFAASRPGTTFECSLDGRAFSFCKSPKKYINLTGGNHHFAVRSIDNGGADPTPATRSFTVDAKPPEGTLLIDRGRRVSRTRTVTLSTSANDPSPASGLESMRFRNAGQAWGGWRPYAERTGWKLSRGEGKKIVYVQYRDKVGNISARASDSIVYRR